MSVTSQPPRDILRDFIQLYESFPCMWQTKHKDYNDRNKKNKAYAALLEKLKQLEPYADKNTVAKKINALRTVYRKEVLKVKRSLESGACGDDVYEPKLWYFDLFHFLNDQDLVWTAGTMGVKEEEQTQYIDPFEGQAAGAAPDESDEYVPEELPLEQTSTPAATTTRPGSNPRVAVRRRINTAELQETGTGNKVLEVETNRLEEEEDECDLFGKMMAKKLRKLPEYERELVMYEIHGVFVNRRQLIHDDDGGQL